MNCYLTSVYHTGTQYFKHGLEKHYRVAISHLNDSVLDQLKEYETIFTTYRDPLHVAASWANRDRFRDDVAQFDRWEEQWTCYHRLQAYNPKVLNVTKGNKQHGIEFGNTPINQHEDKYNLHKAVDNGDIEPILNYIPEELIDYAIYCSEWAKS